MITAMVAGGIAGLGVYLLVRLLVQPRASLVSALGRLDAGRLDATSRRPESGREQQQLSEVPDRIGAIVARELRARGFRLVSVRADLQILDRSLESFLGMKILLALAGVLMLSVLNVVATILGYGLPMSVPLWGGLAMGTILFFAPDASLHSEAEAKRRDFRHAVGSFLDLVAMNLAGGRGVPEALQTAAAVSDTRPFVRIRDALAGARLAGLTPWAALGRLGEDLAVDELRDLAASLTLVADDGAKVRASLNARAATLRRRELSDIEGKAGERSQTMLVAQLLLCAAFFLFLAYPAAYRVFTS